MEGQNTFILIACSLYSFIAKGSSFLSGNGSEGSARVWFWPALGSMCHPCVVENSPVGGGPGTVEFEGESGKDRVSMKVHQPQPSVELG